MKDKPDNAIYTTLEQKKTLSESASGKAERRMSQVSRPSSLQTR